MKGCSRSITICCETRRASTRRKFLTTKDSSEAKEGGILLSGLEALSMLDYNKLIFIIDLIITCLDLSSLLVIIVIKWVLVDCNIIIVYNLLMSLKKYNSCDPAHY